MKAIDYVSVIEQTETGYSAYVPDLPGCVATGRSREEVAALLHEAVQFHLDGLRLEGIAVPAPRAEATIVSVQ